MQSICFVWRLCVLGVELVVEDMRNYMQKAIFLDIDGVLNCKTTKCRCPSGAFGVEDYLVSHLGSIVKYSGASIVLTSTWKIASADDYKYLEDKLAKYGVVISDKTCDNISNRGYGIKEYLKNHSEITAWVVIDDTCFYDFDDEIINHSVMTTFYKYALSSNKASHAISILNGMLNNAHDRRIGMNIYIITADYRNTPDKNQYAVQANTKKEAKEYFRNKYSWLTVYRVDRYTGNPAEIKWFW